MFKKIFVLLILFPAVAFANEIVVVNEEKLKELINGDVPSIERINMLITQSNLERSSYNQKFSPFVKAEASYANVNGSMYDNYVGSFSDPEKRVGMSVSQNLPIGVSFEAGVYDGYSKYFNHIPQYSSISSQYDSVAEAKLTLDLWKNLLGYSDKAERAGLIINEQEKIEQAKLEKIKFYNELRKMYWDLGISNSLKKIYEALINQAVIQEDNIRRMYNDSVADRGDLARATALVNTRKADLLNVEYNIKKTTQNISNLIPELNNKEIQFNFDTFETSKKKIEACFARIKMEKEPPFNLSSYTKLIRHKDDKVKANLKSLERYSDVDVKLEARAAGLGFGDDNGDSLSDMAKLERRDYSVDLNLSMPFGKNYRNTKENQMKLLKMQYNAEKKEIISNMTSFHNYFSQTLENLFAIRIEQKKYRDNLVIRVQSMRKKYNQGRISLSELIQDEDSLFESELGLIRTEYSIITLMIDYFSIFNEIDCEFNIKI